MASWIRLPASWLRPLRSRGVAKTAFCRYRKPLHFEKLEDRTVPSVTVDATFSGLDFADTLGYVPPDTIVAAGPDHIVEAVNTTLAIYNKDGSQVLQQDFGDFFNNGNSLSDPVVSYDELAGVFFVGILDFTNNDFVYTRFADFAGAWDASDAIANTHSVNVDEAGGFFGLTIGDYPRLGWNADAYFVSLNMFDAMFLSYNHVSLLTIAKDDFANPTQVAPFGVDNADHFTLTPAVMHGSVPGDPMYFVEEAGYQNGSAVRVVKVTDPLGSPTFQSFHITVDSYSGPPSATQPGGKANRNLIETNDARVLHAEWRDDMLVATHTVGQADGLAHARWYMFDTSGTPTLIQQETLGVGSGATSFFPAVAIDPSGNVGMTYMQVSRTNNEYMSMYVGGATYSSTPFAMSMESTLVRAGLATYKAFDGSPYRAGDYSGISVDPVDGSFWAANEYATSATSSAANWGTAITHFSLSAPLPVHDVAVTALDAPTSVTPGTVVDVAVTVANFGDFAETFDVSLASSGGTVTGSPQNVTLAAGASQVVNFAWDTSGLDGPYTLTATAATVAGETSTSNNAQGTDVFVGTAPAPVVVSGISPTSFTKGGSTTVTITGSGFLAGAVVTFENGSGGSTPLASVTSVAADGTSLTATVTTNKGFKGGTWDIRVTNPDGNSGVLSGQSIGITNALPAPRRAPSRGPFGARKTELTPPEIVHNGPVVAQAELVDLVFSEFASGKKK